MTRTDLKTFRNALENQQGELGRGSRNRGALAIERSPDELDRIQDAGDRDWAMGNLERNSTQSREVRAALGRFDDGTYGICLECGESINPKRLVALPWASFCVVCQGAAEREQKVPRNEVDTPLVM